MVMYRFCTPDKLVRFRLGAPLLHRQVGTAIKVIVGVAKQKPKTSRNESVMGGVYD